jgi:hypothetical protein
MLEVCVCELLIYHIGLRKLEMHWALETRSLISDVSVHFFLLMIYR